jgi:hypothetical protein
MRLPGAFPLLLHFTNSLPPGLMPIGAMIAAKPRNPVLCMVPHLLGSSGWKKGESHIFGWSNVLHILVTA